MSDRKTINDMTHDITNALEHEASMKRASEVAKAQSYYEGYIQACNDYGRRIRDSIACLPD